MACEAQYALKGFSAFGNASNVTCLTEFKGYCFSCHDVDGGDEFAVIFEKMSVDNLGVPQTM